MAKEQEVLHGMKEICDFLSRSEATVLKIIRSENLQNKKVAWKRGGMWVANRERLRQFWVHGVDEW